jgi:hypothetical protein
MYDGKQNPAIARGDSESVQAYIGRMRDFVQQLEWRSDGHRFWYTHKNPHGCWICDLIFTIEQYSRCIDDMVQERDPDSGTSNPEGKQLLDDRIHETHELEDK